MAHLVSASGRNFKGILDLRQFWRLTMANSGPESFRQYVVEYRMGRPAGCVLALIAGWRAARDAGTSLAPAQQAELEALVDAEVLAAGKRAAALGAAIGR
jgi:hypothetical protein